MVNNTRIIIIIYPIKHILKWTQIEHRIEHYFKTKNLYFCIKNFICVMFAQLCVCNHSRAVIRDVSIKKNILFSEKESLGHNAERTGRS